MLYKYRTIENFQFFVDILLNERLFAAPYFDLNDPMEGHFRYLSDDVFTPEIINSIKSEKGKVRICSLSRRSDIPLMWAHYTNGCRGVVIGVDIDKNLNDLRPVKYGHGVFGAVHKDGPVETAKRILTYKNEIWAYEEEERIFTTGDVKFIKVKVRELILGLKIDAQTKSLVKKLVEKIMPEVKISNYSVKNKW